MTRDKDSPGIAAAPDGNTALGITFAVTSGAMFATTDATAKWLSADLPAEMLVWGRYVFHLGFMLLLFPGPRLKPLLVTGKPVALIVRALLLVGCSYLFFIAISHIPLADANAIAFFAPFFVVALSVPLLKEKVGVRRWSAVGVGFLGILLIIRPGFQEVHWTYFALVLMALLYALFTIMTRSLVRTENALSMLFYNAVVGTVVASAVVVFSWVTPTLEQLAFMALIGAVGGGSHLLVIHAYRNASASLLAPFQYLQMVWATAWGYLLFSHFPDNWTLAGAGVIVSSGLYVWFREIQLGKQRRSTSWRGGLPR